MVPPTRDRGMAGHEAPPRPVHADADADARSPGHRPEAQPVVFDCQRARDQVAAVVPQRHAQGPGQVAGPAAQRVDRRSGPACRRRRIRATPSKRRDRAEQHRRRVALAFGHRVQQVVDPVVQVDVGDPRRAVQRCVAPGRPWCRMASRIRFADVSLYFDNRSGDAASAGRVVHQHLADQLLGHAQRRPLVEFPRQAPLRPRAGKLDR